MKNSLLLILFLNIPEQVINDKGSAAFVPPNGEVGTFGAGVEQVDHLGSKIVIQQSITALWC